jgi:glycine/D-amino acid oxidase-like deaminating enzyme
LTSDVAIVGAGITGLSVAFHLAERDVGSIIVYEREGIGAGASGVQPGACDSNDAQEMVVEPGPAHGGGDDERDAHQDGDNGGENRQFRRCGYVPREVLPDRLKVLKRLPEIALEQVRELAPAGTDTRGRVTGRPRS